MIDEAKTQITDMMDCFLSFQLSYILRESHTELSQMLEESFQKHGQFFTSEFQNILDAWNENLYQRIYSAMIKQWTYNLETADRYVFKSEYEKEKVRADHLTNVLNNYIADLTRFELPPLDTLIDPNLPTK